MSEREVSRTEAAGPAVPTVKAPTREPATPTIRRKLQVGSVDDVAERDADRMADLVMGQLMRSPVPTGPATSKIRRRESGPGTVIGAEGGQVDDSTDRRIRSARGGGTPLPVDHQERFGAAFGTDFSNVRLHTDGEAADISRSIQAEAFTIGNDVFFGGGAPTAGTPSGDRLLAHELSHVVQQSGSAHRSMIRRAYVKGTAKKDLPLFGLQDPKVGDDSLSGATQTKATELGINGLNMAHYLERHTFKYQKLTGPTTKQRAGMFPLATDAAGVKAMLIEALGKVPKGTVIGESVESVTVDLANGLKVNLGALKGGKLSAFFPIAGTGFHYYDDGELNEIRKEKNGGGGS